MTLQQLQCVSGWAERHFQPFVGAGVFDEALVGGSRVRPYALLHLALADEMWSLIVTKQITEDQAAMIVHDLKRQLPTLWTNAMAGLRERLTVEFADTNQAPIVLEFIEDALDRCLVSAPSLLM